MAKRSKKQNTDGQIGVIYARYSSHAQRDCSIEQQVEAATAFARENHLRITRIYSDRAVSGKTDKRPEFQKMLRDAEKGEFQYVVAWKSNRIGRNMLQAMVNEERLSEMGVKCIYVEEDFEDNAAGRFALRSMMNVNQFYIENMAEDITRGLRDSAKQCRVLGSLPFGLKKAENGRYAIDDEKAVIVREIFRRVAGGESQASVMDDLNRRGIQTNRKLPWSKNSMAKLLQNDKYIGVYRYMDIEVPDGIPRILTDEQFYKVQEVLRMKPNPVQNMRRRTPNGEYLLTGKLFCGKCGSFMVGTCGRGKLGQNYYYYECSGRRATHQCDKKNVRRDEIEDAVANAIMQYAMTDDVIEWIADMTMAWSERQEKDAGLDLINAQITENEKKLGNLMKAIEMGIITESTKTRLQELESKRKTLAGQLSAAKSEILILTKPELIAGLRAFRNGDINDQGFRRSLFDTFIKAVYLYDDELRIVFSYAKGNDSVTVSLKDIAEDSPEKGADAAQEAHVGLMPKVSDKPHSGALVTSYPNPTHLFMRQGYFVLVVPYQSQAR